MIRFSLNGLRGNISKLLITTRPWSFLMTIVSVSVGTVLAYKQGVFDIITYLLTLLGCIFAHASANVLNDYFDTLYGIDNPDSPTAKYRPHPIFSKFLTLNTLLIYAIILIVPAIIIGLYLTLIKGLLVLYLAVLGLILGISYSGIYKLKHYGLGEITVFIIWGPLMVLGAYYTQLQQVAIGPLLVSIPIGLLVSSVLLANNIRDIEFDKKSGIITVATILGRNRSINLLAIMLLTSYLIIIILCIIHLLDAYSLVILIALPYALKLISIFKRSVPEDADPKIANHVLLFGIILIFSLIIT